MNLFYREVNWNSFGVKHVWFDRDIVFQLHESRNKTRKLAHCRVESKQDEKRKKWKPREEKC